MYRLKPGIKDDPARRWALPDRVFFSNGACHILAGVYLARRPGSGFHAEWIIPGDGFAGNHIYVTDGRIAFDYHGYSCRRNLLVHHTSGWSGRYASCWNCIVERVDFDLLDTAQLNARKMLGPMQYRGDPMVRAERFMQRFRHEEIAVAP